MFITESTRVNKQNVEITAMHETTARLFLAAKEIAGASSLTEVAKLLKQTTQTVKNWEARGMSQAGINTACSVLEIAPKWLATGEGEMRGITATASATFPAITGSASGTVGEPPPSLERALEVLASHLDQLSNIEREAAASSLQTLARAPDSAKAKSSVLESLGAKNHTAISASTDQKIPDFLKK
jgi:hypothetical protein